MADQIFYRSFVIERSYGRTQGEEWQWRCEDIFDPLRFAPSPEACKGAIDAKIAEWIARERDVEVLP